jgi:hypothetical protein
MLVEGFNGRYEFERVHGTDGRYKEVPKKNKWSHLNDALQYLCLGILATTDIQGSEPDEFEDAPSRLLGGVNQRRYSGY